MSRTRLEATTAYYRTVPGVTMLRFTLAFLQRLWPALAVRTAGRLFLTPLPPKWLVRGKPWSRDWQVRRLPFEEASVTMYDQGGTGAIVLLAHSWGGHARQMQALAQGLRAAGMRPVIMEMPAHGRSAGLQTNLPQFARALDYVVARLGDEGHPSHALVAHSLGATAAAFAAARKLPLQRLVLIAPAASPPAYTRMFAHVFDLSERTRSGMQARIEAREGVLMHHFEPPMLGRGITIPLLLVHDEGDTVNPFGDSVAYAEAVPGTRLIRTAGLGHRVILKDAAVVAQVVAFAHAEAVGKLRAV